MTTSRKVDRAVRFIQLLANSRLPVPLSKFSDPEEWGDERTFRRLRNEINQAWIAYSTYPLFETVDELGKPATKGKRFLKLTSEELAAVTSNRIAALIGVLEFTKTVSGSILHDELNILFREGFSKVSKKQLRKLRNKFSLVTKGQSIAADTQDELDAIYDGLLTEKNLEAELFLKGEWKQKTVSPLSLVLFNGGLYLLARIVSDEKKEKIYSISLMNIKKVRKTNASFRYPESFNVNEYFQESFGLMAKGEVLQKVKLKFKNENSIINYLQSRRWGIAENKISIEEDFVLLEFQTASLSEAKSWIMGFGHKAEVLGPPQLRQQVTREIEDLHSRYVA